MTTYVSDAYLAADYAVPMVKALSFTPLFEAAVASFPALTRVWSLRSWPFAGAFAPLARGILPQRVSQQYGGLTTPDHVARLSILHPDYRLAYLSEVGFSDDDVVASAEIVDGSVPAWGLNLLEPKTRLDVRISSLLTGFRMSRFCRCGRLLMSDDTP